MHARYTTRLIVLFCAALCACRGAARAGDAPSPDAVVFTGRVYHPRFPGGELMPLSTVNLFAAREGTASEPVAFRTWETDPPGWYRVSGMPGRYTLLFTGPAHFIRPTLFTNQFTTGGETVSRIVTPNFDYALFDQQKWDSKAAHQYDQLFIAEGTSITQVGFKPVHDGVDGMGPGAQDLLVSVHKQGAGTPDTWEQVGPATLVPNVDCGGAKSYTFSAGWNSGEVPVTPGGAYAVRLRPANANNVFQMFWRQAADKRVDCYRTPREGPGAFSGQSLWMSVASDCDGLLIPYNKRVHKQFGTFAGMSKRWAQSYVAQGRGLAGAIMYAAVSGAQPQLSRQRCVVRVHRDTVDGPLAGREKIAIGTGNYTGDASWGMFGLAYAPGEVELEPGRTYVIEFENIETYETLHGFVNIKGQLSDDRAALNPYRKHPRDNYEQGTAYQNGQPKDFDLDMQILEYRFAAKDWQDKVEGENLLRNGDAQAGEFDAAQPARGKPEHWTTFAIEPATALHYAADGEHPDNRILRVIGGSFTRQPADGGFVAQVTGLASVETYRIAGKVRSSYALDEKHTVYVGWDLTGQTTDPKAATIVWTPAVGYHGIFNPFGSPPLRPKKDAISVWLRGRTTQTVDTSFRADFDDFSVRKMSSGAPLEPK